MANSNTNGISPILNVDPDKFEAKEMTPEQAEGLTKAVLFVPGLGFTEGAKTAKAGGGFEYNAIVAYGKHSDTVATFEMPAGRELYEVPLSLNKNHSIEDNVREAVKAVISYQASLENDKEAGKEVKLSGRLSDEISKVFKQYRGLESTKYAKNSEAVQSLMKDVMDRGQLSDIPAFIYIDTHKDEFKDMGDTEALRTYYESYQNASYRNGVVYPKGKDLSESEKMGFITRGHAASGAIKLETESAYSSEGVTGPLFLTGGKKCWGVALLPAFIGSAVIFKLNGMKWGEAVKAAYAVAPLGLVRKSEAFDVRSKFKLFREFVDLARTESLGKGLEIQMKGEKAPEAKPDGGAEERHAGMISVEPVKDPAEAAAKKPDAPEKNGPEKNPEAGKEPDGAEAAKKEPEAEAEPAEKQPAAEKKDEKPAEKDSEKEKGGEKKMPEKEEKAEKSEKGRKKGKDKDEKGAEKSHFFVEADTSSKKKDFVHGEIVSAAGFISSRLKPDEKMFRALEKDSDGKDEKNITIGDIIKLRGDFDMSVESKGIKDTLANVIGIESYSDAFGKTDRPVSAAIWKKDYSKMMEHDFREKKGSSLTKYLDIYRLAYETGRSAVDKRIGDLAKADSDIEEIAKAISTYESTSPQADEACTRIAACGEIGAAMKPKDGFVDGAEGRVKACSKLADLAEHANALQKAADVEKTPESQKKADGAKEELSSFLSGLEKEGNGVMAEYREQLKEANASRYEILNQTAAEAIKDDAAALEKKPDGGDAAGIPETKYSKPSDATAEPEKAPAAEPSAEKTPTDDAKGAEPAADENPFVEPDPGDAFDGPMGASNSGMSEEEMAEADRLMNEHEDADGGKTEDAKPEAVPEKAGPAEQPSAERIKEETEKAERNGFEVSLAKGEKGGSDQIVYRREFGESGNFLECRESIVEGSTGLINKKDSISFGQEGGTEIVKHLDNAAAIGGIFTLPNGNDGRLETVSPEGEKKEFFNAADLYAEIAKTPGLEKDLDGVAPDLIAQAMLSIEEVGKFEASEAGPAAERMLENAERKCGSGKTADIERNRDKILAEISGKLANGDPADGIAEIIDNAISHAIGDDYAEASEGQAEKTGAEGEAEDDGRRDESSADAADARKDD